MLYFGMKPWEIDDMEKADVVCYTVLLNEHLKRLHGTKGQNDLDKNLKEIGWKVPI